jgi:hypothetical protein
MTDAYNARPLSDIEETMLNMVKHKPGTHKDVLVKQFRIPALGYLALLYLQHIQLVYEDVTTGNIHLEEKPKVLLCSNCHRELHMADGYKL